jgi:hypothetical protein
MSFSGYCAPGISPDIIIYFCLLHNLRKKVQKIIRTIGHVLLFTIGFVSSVLIAILIFFGSMVNSGFRESIFCHYVTSAGCLIILTSCLWFSLCHYNNPDFLFANQRFKREMIEKYQNTFLVPHFLLFLL